MGHHPQITFTHRGKDRRDGDGIWGEVLELHPVMVAERPHEAAGAIHSGDDSNVRRRRSPSLSSSSSQRSVIDDGRQSSAATSLTGIMNGRRADSLLLEGVRARETARELRRREG